MSQTEVAPMTKKQKAERLKLLQELRATLKDLNPELVPVADLRRLLDAAELHERKGRYALTDETIRLLDRKAELAVRSLALLVSDTVADA